MRRGLIFIFVPLCGTRYMMNYDMMWGLGGNSMMLFAWIPYLLTVALLVLGIVALWKYINKK